MRLNVQADVRRRLEEALPGVEVRVNVPPERPDRLVVVTREGGRRLNELQDRAGVGLLCWAPTEEEACELADRASDVMASLPFSGGYDLVREESLYSDPDPNARAPRWYGSYTITTHHYEG